MKTSNDPNRMMRGTGFQSWKQSVDWRIHALIVLMLLMTIVTLALTVIALGG